MTKLLSAAAIAALIISSPAIAQEPYVEGQISHMMIDDNDGSISASAGGFSAAATGVFHYDDATAFGVEVGLASIGGTGFRAGVSYTMFDAELEAVDGSGAVSYNGTVLLAAAGRVTADQIRNAGVEIGEKVRAYSINGYYDVDLGSAFKPYLGLGIGIADIENMEDNELLLSGFAGVNYAFTENFYAGLRASIHNVAGPTDKFGIKYDDFRTYAVGAVIGYKF